MAAPSPNTDVSATIGPLSPPPMQKRSSSADLHHGEGATASTPSDPLLGDPGSASDALSAGATTQVGESLSRADSTLSRRAGTRSSHQISTTSARARHSNHGRIVATYYSIQEWISHQNWWPWEVGCWLCSLGFLLAILAVLAGFDGKTTPQWKFGITVNTLVSVFGTINVLLLTIIVSAGIGQVKWIWFRRHSRSLVDFDIIDKASKGATGSLTLLLRWRGGLLGIVGACLTILILGIGPFTQQIIAFEIRPVSELTASIPVARNYDPPSNLQETTLSVDMKAAVLDGALTTSTVEYKNTPSCATGNCTWSSYQSLAVCSACEVVNGSEIEKLLNVNSSLLALLEEADFLVVLPYWNPLPFSAEDPAYIANAVPTLAFPDHGILVADVFLIAASKPFECILDFCVKTYNASVNDGNFTENEIKRVHQQGPTRMINSYNEYSEGSNDYPVLNFSQEDVTESHYIVPDNIYYLSQYINSTFGGSVTSAPDNGENPEDSLAFSSDVVEALWNMIYKDGQLTPDILFENTAKSLTKVIRGNAYESDGSKNTLAMGSTLHNETFISVRWLWIILPATVQLFALAFLIVVIRVTKQAGLEAYKDGILPTLFQGIDEESRRDMGRVMLLSDMAMVAENTEMTLHDQPSAGWSLSTVPNQSRAKGHG